MSELSDMGDGMAGCGRTDEIEMPQVRDDNGVESHEPTAYGIRHIRRRKERIDRLKKITIK